MSQHSISTKPALKNAVPLDEVLTSPKGLSIPALLSYFENRDAAEWHRRNEWLGFSDATTASFLPGLVGSLEARAITRIEDDDASKIISDRTLQFRDKSGMERSVPIYPVARVEAFGHAPRCLELFFQNDDRISDAPDYARDFLLSIRRQVTQYRIEGLEPTTTKIPRHDGITPGQLHLSLLTEMLRGEYCALPKFTGGGTFFSGVWYLVERSSLAPASNDSESQMVRLSRIHNRLWDVLPACEQVLGSRWLDGIQSLAHSFDLPHGTAEAANGNRQVWIGASDGFAPNGDPLQLVFERDPTIGGSGLRCFWAHHR